MRACMTLIAVLTLSILFAKAQSEPGNVTTPPATSFPKADFVLKDAHHKEPNSGVQLQGGQLTIASGVGTSTAINILSFSADGRILAAGKDFGRVVVWNVSGGKNLRALDTEQGQVLAVSVSPDGKLLATSGTQDNNSVRVWNISDGKLLWTFRQSKTPIGQLFFNSEGKSLVATDNAANVYVLDATEHKVIATLPEIHATAMSLDAQSLITADGKEFAVWNVSKWRKTQSVPTAGKFALLLAANPATDQLAVYVRRTVRIDRLSTGQVVVERADLVQKNFTWRPTFGAFDSSGTLLYLSIDGHLVVLSVKAGDTCSSPTMYSGAAALSPDGRWFAGAKDDSIFSQERTDGVWIWDTGKLLKKCGMSSRPMKVQK